MINTEVHDGFEGLWSIFLFPFLFPFLFAVIAILLPVVTAIRKMIVDENRGSVPRGYLVLLSMWLYYLSVLLFFLFIMMNFTDSIRHITVCCGSLAAIAAFVVSLLARGPGRIPAIAQGIYSLSLWIWIFYYGIFIR